MILSNFINLQVLSFEIRQIYTMAKLSAMVKRSGREGKDQPSPSTPSQSRQSR